MKSNPTSPRITLNPVTLSDTCWALTANVQKSVKVCGNTTLPTEELLPHGPHGLDRETDMQMSVFHFILVRPRQRGVGASRARGGGSGHFPEKVHLSLGLKGGKGLAG